MAPATPPGRGHIIVKDAFRGFVQALRGNDERLFESTTLADVREACQIIERDQGQRKCLRNMRRIEPVLECMGKFGGAIETLCQGTPFLCFIWAPIKLLLQIADEYTQAFEHLLDAYHQIAQLLPRCDRLGKAFYDQEDFQTVLAEIYSDILEFHSHAYAYLRRNGWKRLFDASWRSFSGRFNSILQRLARNRDLVDKEAQSYSILEGKEFRQKILEQIDRSEKDRFDCRLRDTLAWLDLKGQDREQQDLFECRSTARKEGTCEWILNNSKVRSWLDPEDGRSLLWLCGKPGSGKTTLATFLTDLAPVPPDGTILYCLCSYGFGRSEASVCSLTFRSLISQLVRKEPSLLPHVYDNYVKTGILPTANKAKDLFRDLLRASGPTFIIVDGLDECDGMHQRQLLSDLDNLRSSSDERRREYPDVKILVCSRETKDILAKLRKCPQVFLTDEHSFVSKDIASFAKASLSPLRDRFSTHLLEEVEQVIVTKADGMFLWVRLVLDVLLDQHSIYDLKNTLNELPTGLPGVYASILKRIESCITDAQKLRFKHILSWLAFSYRPLKSWELCDAIVFQDTKSALDASTRLGKGILDICKPLIEERDDCTVVLVHFSLREFLLHVKSGPYFTRQLQHIQITQACIRYLMTCRCFADGPLTPLTQSNVVKGFHDLFPYVNQYWTLHLLESFKEVSRFIAGSEEDAAIQETYDLLSALIQLMKRPVTEGYDDEEERELEHRIGALHARPMTLKHLPTGVDRYLTFRKTIARRTEPPAAPNSAPRQPPAEDPTLLGVAFSRFQQAFESLLGTESPDTWCRLSVTRDELDGFYARHSSSAYLCQWRGCVWASIGFKDPTERARHEARHEERYRCPDPACDFANRGFTTRQALQRHNETYHMSLQDVVLPKFKARSTDRAPPRTSKSSLSAGVVQVPLDRRRLKVYELRDNDWFDRGTGFCTVQVINDEPRLYVESEDRPDIMLLEGPIDDNNGYQKQEDKLIEYTEHGDTDIALSFEHAEGCAVIWDFICQVRDQPEDKLSELIHSLRNSGSQASHTAEFETTNEQPQPKRILAEDIWWKPYESSRQTPSAQKITASERPPPPQPINRSPSPFPQVTIPAHLQQQQEYSTPQLQQKLMTRQQQQEFMAQSQAPAQGRPQAYEQAQGDIIQSGKARAGAGQGNVQLGSTQLPPPPYPSTYYTPSSTTALPQPTPLLPPRPLTRLPPVAPLTSPRPLTRLPLVAPLTPVTPLTPQYPLLPWYPSSYYTPSSTAPLLLPYPSTYNTPSSTTPLPLPYPSTYNTPSSTT